VEQTSDSNGGPPAGERAADSRARQSEYAQLKEILADLWETPGSDRQAQAALLLEDQPKLLERVLGMLAAVETRGDPLREALPLMADFGP
jgi:hypothetical protein